MVVSVLGVAVVLVEVLVGLVGDASSPPRATFGGGGGRNSLVDVCSALGFGNKPGRNTGNGRTGSKTSRDTVVAAVASSNTVVVAQDSFSAPDKGGQESTVEENSGSSATGGEVEGKITPEQAVSRFSELKLLPDDIMKELVKTCKWCGFTLSPNGWGNVYCPGCNCSSEALKYGIYPLLPLFASSCRASPLFTEQQVPQRGCNIGSQQALPKQS